MTRRPSGKVSRRRLAFASLLVGVLTACTKIQGLPEDAGVAADASDVVDVFEVRDSSVADRCFEEGAVRPGTFTVDNLGAVLLPSTDRGAFSAIGAVRDPGGALFVFGARATSAERGLANAAVLHFDARGNLLRSWGDGGLVEVDTSEVPTGARADVFRAAAFDAEGRLVLAGYSYDVNLGRHAALVVRILPGGGLDPTFGQRGVASVRPETGTFSASDLLLDDLGILLVGDDREGGEGQRGMAARLTPDGTESLSFGRSGFWSSAGVTYLRSVVADGDGYVVSATSVAARSAALLRLTRDGETDVRFGAGGVAVHPEGFATWPVAMQRRPDGRLLVLAQTRYSASREGVQTLLGFAPDGTPDARFGVRGVASPREGDIGHYTNSRYTLALLCDGAALTFTLARSGALLLQRFGPDASEDRTFGEQSRALWYISDGSNNVPVAVLPDEAHATVTAVAATAAGRVGVYRLGL